MPDTKIRFLAPVDVFTRLEKSRYILSAKESQEILRFVGMTPETDTLIRYMRQHNSVLEQETYLLPMAFEGTE